MTKKDPFVNGLLDFPNLKLSNTRDSTLKKYGNYSASELVDITHRDITPWSKTGKGIFANRIIDKDTILKYHVNEYV